MKNEIVTIDTRDLRNVQGAGIDALSAGWRAGKAVFQQGIPYTGIPSQYHGFLNKVLYGTGETAGELATGA